MTRAEELCCAHRAGCEAYWAHQNEAANPYRPLNGPHANAWLDGWQTARKSREIQHSALVQGGQGRDAKDIEDSASLAGTCVLCAALAVLLAICLSGCASDLRNLSGIL